jgi:hypothetical protein
VNPLPGDIVAAFVDRCREEWRKAGLPGHVTDVGVLDRVARLVASDHVVITSRGGGTTSQVG